MPLLAFLRPVPVKVRLILATIIAVALWYWRATDAADHRGKLETSQQIEKERGMLKSALILSCVALIAAMTAVCAPSIATTDGCTIFRPIYGSRSDTQKTRDQVG